MNRDQGFTTLEVIVVAALVIIMIVLAFSIQYL